jgi:hypothetical protein
VSLPQLKDRCLALFIESDDVVVTPPQEVRDLASGAIAAANPHELRRRPSNDGEPVEVFVFTHDEAVVRSRKIPNSRIGGAALAKYSNV